MQTGVALPSVGAEVQGHSRIWSERVASGWESVLMSHLAAVTIHTDKHIYLQTSRLDKSNVITFLNYRCHSEGLSGHSVSNTMTCDPYILWPHGPNDFSADILCLIELMTMVSFQSRLSSQLTNKWLCSLSQIFSCKILRFCFITYKINVCV
jgi:hypothetical protein